MNHMPDIEHGVTLLEYDRMPLAALIQPRQNTLCSCINKVTSYPLFYPLLLICCILIVGLIFWVVAFEYTPV